MATFTLTTEAYKEAYIPPAIENTFPFLLETTPLAFVPYIHHLLWFKKDKTEVPSLLDSGNEVNSIILAYAANLTLKVWPINIKTQKINGSTFKMFEIVLANFQVQDKLDKAQLFQMIYLVVNTSVAVILNMFFLIFNNTDMLFVERKLT